MHFALTESFYSVCQENCGTSLPPPIFFPPPHCNLNFLLNFPTASSGTVSYQHFRHRKVLTIDLRKTFLHSFLGGLHSEVFAAGSVVRFWGGSTYSEEITLG